MDKKSKIGGSISLAIVISYLSLFVSIVATVFFTPFLIKKVGDDYGVFGLVQSITSWLTLLSTAMSASFVRFAVNEIKNTNQEEPEKTNTVFFLILLCCAFASLVFGLIISFLFSFGIINNQQLMDSQHSLFVSMMFLSTIQTAFSIIFSFFQAYVLFKRRFVILRSVTLFYSILYPVISTVFLLFFPSMFLVVIIMFLVTDVGSIILLVYSFTRLKIRFSKIKEASFNVFLKSIIAFSFFILINTIIDTFNSSIDRILLGFMCGVSFVTIYQLGMSFRTYLTSLSLVVSSNYIPQINQHAVDDDIDGVNKLFFKIGTNQALIVLLIIGGFAACGPEFVNWWAGGERSDVFVVGLVLMIDGSFPLCENISIEYQRAKNKHHFRAYLYLFFLIVNFVVSFCLLKFIPTFNPIYSCLIGTVVSDFFSRWIIINIYNHKVLKLKIMPLFLAFVYLSVITLAGIGASYGIQMLFFSTETNLLYLIVAKGIVFILVFSFLTTCTIIFLVKYKRDFASKVLPSRMLIIFEKIRHLFGGNKAQTDKNAIRLTALDGLRVVMAFIVFLSHLNVFINLENGSVFEQFFRNPIFAVDFFFVLSGIGLMISSYKTDTIEYPSLKEAFLNGLKRLFKLYGIYLAALIFAIPAFILIRYQNSSPSSLFVNASLKTGIYLTSLQSLSGVEVIEQNINGVAWYISCLVIIEFFAPYLVVWFRKRIMNLKKAFCFLMILFVFIPLLYYLFKYIESVSFFDYLAYGTPYIRIFYVGIGMIIGMLYVFAKNSKTYQTFCKVGSIIFFMLFIAWFISRNTVRSLFLAIDCGHILVWFLLPLIDIVLCFLLAFSFTGKSFLSLVFGSKRFRSVAKITLPFYLFHAPIITIVDYITTHCFDNSLLQTWFFRSGEAIVILSIAVIVSICWNKISLHFKNKIIRKKSLEIR